MFLIQSLPLIAFNNGRTVFASKMKKCHGCSIFESVSLEDKPPEKYFV